MANNDDLTTSTSVATSSSSHGSAATDAAASVVPLAIVSPTMHAVYFLLDTQSLPHEAAVHAAVHASGAIPPMCDTLVISRDDIEQPAKRVGFAGTPGTPAKKKAAKKVEELSEAEERERALVTVNDELIDGLRGMIDREILSRIELITDHNRAAAEALQSPSSPKSGSKGGKQRSAVKSSSKTSKSSLTSSTSNATNSVTSSNSTNNGPTSSSTRASKRSSSSLGTTSGNNNDRPSSSSGRDTSPSPSASSASGSGSGSGSGVAHNDMSSLSSSTSVAPVTAASIPLHIILRDVIRKVGDVERLHAAGISLSAALTFQGQETVRQVAPIHDTNEFLYGAPVTAMALHRMSDELYEDDDITNRSKTALTNNSATIADRPSTATTSTDTIIMAPTDDSKRGTAGTDKKIAAKTSSSSRQQRGVAGTAVTTSVSSDKKVIDDKKVVDGVKRTTSSSGTTSGNSNSNTVTSGNDDKRDVGRVRLSSAKKDKEVKLSLTDRLLNEARLAAETVTRGASSLMNDIRTLAANDTRFSDVAIILVSLPSPPVIHPTIGATGSNITGGHHDDDNTNTSALMSPKSLPSPSSSGASRGLKTPDASRGASGVTGEKKDVPSSSPSSSSLAGASKLVGKKESKSSKSSLGGKGRSKGRNGDDDATASLAQSAIDTTAVIAQEILLQLRHISGQLTDFSEWRRDARVVELPTSLQTLQADTRLYTSLMDHIHDTNISVPLLLHCLFEQVAANVSPSSHNHSIFNDDRADGLDHYFDQAFARVAATVAPSKPSSEPHQHIIAQSSSIMAAGGERTVDKNGHIWLHARCIRCGDLQALSDELVNANATSLAAMLPATPYCPATVGAPHQWYHGTCQACHTREPISTADRMAHLAKFCPVTIGGVHLYDSLGECSACGAQLPSDADASQSIGCNGNGDSDSHIWTNGICMACGAVETTTFQQTLSVELSRSRLLVSRGQLARGVRQCPSLDALPSTTPPPTVMLKYGDTSLIRQAKLSLAMGGIWQPHHFTEVVDRLVSDLLILPGVHRRGFPSHDNTNAADRGMEQTALLGRSSLSPVAYERALQCVQFVELMTCPSPSFACISSSPELADVFHPRMATRELERSVRARVRERVWAHMRDNTKKTSGDLITKVIANIATTSQVNNNNAPSSSSSSSLSSNATSSASAASAPVVTAPYLGASLSSGLGLPLHMIGYEDDGVARDWKLGERIYREELDSFVLPQVLADASHATISGIQHIQTRYAAMDDSLLVAYHRHTPLTREMEYNWSDFLCPKMNFSTWQSSSAVVRNTPPRVMYHWSNNHTGVLSRHIKLLYPCDESVMGCTRIISGHRLMVRVWMEKDDHALSLERDTQLPPLVASSIVAGSFAAQEDEKKRKNDSTHMSPPLSSLSNPAAQSGVAAPVTSSSRSNGDGNVLVDEQKRNLVLSHRYSDHTRTTVRGCIANGNIAISYLNDTSLLTTMNTNGSIRMWYPHAPSLSSRQKSTRTTVISSMSSSSLPSSSNVLSSIINGESSDANLYIVGRTNEEWRRVSSDGTVERHMMDGSTIWLYCNGDVARQAGLPSSSSSPIIRTNMNGNRVAIYSSGQQIAQDDIAVARQLDAESGARITSRADLVQYTIYADGSSLVQHADGTRIYVDIIAAPSTSTLSSTSTSSSSSLGSQGGQRITIECPDFPPVIYSHEHKFALSATDHTIDDDINSRHIAQVQQRHIIDVSMSHHDGSITNMRVGEYVRFIKPIAGQLIIGSIGRAIFVPNTAIPSGTQLSSELLHGDIDRSRVPSSCYFIDINDGRLEMIDKEDNTFVCTTSGQSGVLLGRHRGTSSLSSHDDHQMIPARFYPAPDHPIEPRLFVIRSDGSGYELLRRDALSRYVHDASCDPLAPLSILPSEVISNVRVNGFINDETTATTSSSTSVVSHKFLQTLVAAPSYNRQPVIPNVIKAAPSAPVKSIGASTSFVIYRDILQYPPVTANDIERVITARDQYRIWRSNTLHRDEVLDVADVRTDQQRHDELLLANELLAERRRRALIRANDADRAAANERLVLDGVQPIPTNDILPIISTNGNGGQRGIDHSIAPESAPSTSFSTSVATPFPAAPTLTTFFHGQHDGTDHATNNVKQPRVYASPSGISSSSIIPGVTPYFSHATFQKRFAMGSLVRQLRDTALEQAGHMAVTTLLHDLCVFGMALATLLTPSSSPLSSSSLMSSNGNERIRPSVADARLRARIPFTWQREPLSSSLAANIYIRNALPSFIALLGIDRAPHVVTLSSPFPLDATISGKAAKRDARDAHAHDAKRSSPSSSPTSSATSRGNEQWIVSDDVSLAEGLATLQLELEKLQPGVTSLNGWNQSVMVLREEKDHLLSTSDISRSTRAMHQTVNPNFTVHYNGDISASLRGTSKHVVNMLHHDNDNNDDDHHHHDDDDDDGMHDIKEASPIPSSSSLSPLSNRNRGVSPRSVAATAMEQRLRATLHGRPVVHQGHGASFVATALSPAGSLRSSGGNNSTNRSLQPLANVSSSSSSYRRASGDTNARSTPMLHVVPNQPMTSTAGTRTMSSSSSPSSSSSVSITLQPSMIDFGNVGKGGTYRVTFVITNIGRDTCRFNIRAPSHDTLMHLRVLYRPGLIAAGLVRRVELELFAGQPGIYNQHVLIDTDKGVLTLPIVANVQATSLIAANTTSQTPLLPRVPSTGHANSSSSSSSSSMSSAASRTAGGFGRTGKIRLLTEQTTAVGTAVMAAHQRRYASTPLQPSLSSSLVPSSSPSSVSLIGNNASLRGDTVTNDIPVVTNVPVTVRPLSAVKRSRPSSSTSGATSINDDWIVVDGAIHEPIAPIMATLAVAASSTVASQSSSSLSSSALSSIEVMAAKKFGVASISSSSSTSAPQVSSQI